MSSGNCIQCTSPIEHRDQYCRRCGSSTMSAIMPVAAAPFDSKPQDVMQNGEPQSIVKAKYNYEFPMLALPFIGMFACLTFTALIEEEQWPDLLAVIYLAVTAGIALFAALEVEGARVAGLCENTRNNPAMWFLAVFLVWPLAFPAYLFKRRQFGLPNRIFLGIFLMLIFALMMLVDVSFLSSEAAG